METIIISDHAFKRWRERKNLSYNISISKIARQAYARGVEAERYEGTPFESYLKYTAEKFRGNNQLLRVYKNYVFIYGKVDDGIVLITVIEIPEKFWYAKNYAIMK